MAKPGRGILGGFSGKVGTVIGGSWRGIDYMRSLPRKKKNRKFTSAQQLQQAKFQLAANFLSAFKGLFNASFEKENGKTAPNVALRLLMSHSIGGVLPNLNVDYSTVTLAKGSLKKADNGTVASIDPGTLKFNWANNAGLGNATGEDKAILIAYSPDTNDALYTIDGATRQAGESELTVSYFSGKLVHAWIAFRSPNGQLRSESKYLGTVQVL